MTALSTLSHNLGRALTAHSPKILTAIGVTGVLSTSVLAARGTIGAVRVFDKHVEQEDAVPELKETVQLVWKFYIPAAAVGAVTIACIIGGTSISARRNAALLSLYTLTENGFREYQDKVVEHIGEQKERKVRDEIAQDRVNAHPPLDREVIIMMSEGVLMYDQLSGRYFKNNMESIRQSVNDLNQKILHESYASVNDFYEMIGLPRLNYGDEIGWNTDYMLEVDFSATLTDDKKSPCMVLNYRTRPNDRYINSTFR